MLRVRADIDYGLPDSDGEVGKATAPRWWQSPLVTLRVVGRLCIDQLGPMGWVLAASLLAGVLLAALSQQRHADASELLRAARQAVEHSRRASSAATADVAIAHSATQAHSPLLALPDEQETASLLPPELLKKAERRGLKIGTVEYRWTRRDDAMRRLDVQISAVGSYSSSRLWLADALIELPHAQLVEFVAQRDDPSSPMLDVRLQLALHYRPNT